MFKERFGRLRAGRNDLLKNYKRLNIMPLTPTINAHVAAI